MKKYILPYFIFIILLIGFNYGFLLIGFLLGYADSAKDTTSQWTFLFITIMFLNLMSWRLILKHFFKLNLNLFLIIIVFLSYLVSYYYLLNNT